MYDNYAVYRMYLPSSYTLSECLFLQGRDLSVCAVVFVRIELLPKACLCLVLLVLLHALLLKALPHCGPFRYRECFSNKMDVAHSHSTCLALVSLFV